jgi:hypothetical protein
MSDPWHYPPTFGRHRLFLEGREIDTKSIISGLVKIAITRLRWLSMFESTPCRNEARADFAHWMSILCTLDAKSRSTPPPEAWLSARRIAVVLLLRPNEANLKLPIQRRHRHRAGQPLTRNVHFAVRPVPRISDGEAFEEGICLNYFFRLVRPVAFGARHNEGGVGILYC